jgi:hypothetical protein
MPAQRQETEGGDYEKKNKEYKKYVIKLKIP